MKFLRSIFLFGIVGTVGFLADTAVLYLLRDTLGPWVARLCSFLVAVLVTWLMNRYLTFSDRASKLPIHQEFSVYLILMLVGGSVNYGVYAWLIVSDEIVRQHPVLGVACGSLAGMAINLFCAQFLLFRHHIK
ncbi:MAG: GtrA family protein [Burkholderiaceae bacterium]|nr:GtrA family protein [Burkholderiaceae bacterium]